jgi:hypothetical protein
MLCVMEPRQAQGFVLTVALEAPGLTEHHVDRIVRDLSHMTAVRGVDTGVDPGEGSASIHCFVLERTEHDAVCYAIQRVRTAALGAGLETPTITSVDVTVLETDLVTP